jgi:hypothetical protein
MGLNYDSGESTSVKNALSTNLATALSVLNSTDSACTRLVAALGDGELSGRGYSAVDELFAQVIAPSLSRAKDEIASIQEDLDAYTQEDAKVSQYGVLKEAELNTQLMATRNQRDATERQIEANRDAAAALPGLGDALEIKNRQLELVLAQLENDIRELEAKLQALRNFSARTNGLFLDSLENLAAATGDTIALLKQLNETQIGFSFVGDTAGGLGALATRRLILDHLAGKKLAVDSTGRVKWGDRYLYKPRTKHRYSRGEDFNKATGTKIEHYKRPFKAGGSAALAVPVDDFRGWKDASKLSKAGKGLGIAGTALTVGANANRYFSDGVQGHDVQDFAVDTGVDLASAAAAAGIGAAFGSFLLPPLGTVIGAGVGLAMSVVFNAELIDGKSATDRTKDAIRQMYR